MTTPQEPAIQIDYVKYLIPMEVDRMQQFAGRLNAAESADQIGVKYRRDLKLTVLPGGGASGAPRRLVLESWGANCYKLIDWMDSGRAECIVRLDYRRTLPDVTPKQIESYVARTALQGKGRRNVQTFNSRPRMKDASRDIGGFGVTIGSRKSDSHTTIYRRGDEAVAIEHRFQGNRAQDIASDAIARAYDDESETRLSVHMLAALEYAARRELVAATGQMSWEALCADMVVAGDWAAAMYDAASWAETPEENKFWEGLSDDEKSRDLGATFMPTAKGRDPILTELSRIQAESPIPYADHESKWQEHCDFCRSHACYDYHNDDAPPCDPAHW